MKTNKKVLQIVSIIALFLAVVGISVGFALMSTSLEIIGTAKVTPAEWKILFTNATYSDNNTDAYEGKTPSLQDTSFSNYEVVLTKPGDHGTYTITVENQGDIDAKISEVVLGETLTYSAQSQADEDIVRANVSYSITWSDGTAIQTGDTLAAGASKNIIVDVLYDSDADEIPQNEVGISGRTLTILYVQDNG